MHDDLTLTQVLRDPLIRLMLRADGVRFTDFVALLEEAAAKRARTLSVWPHATLATVSQQLDFPFHVAI